MKTYDEMTRCVLEARDEHEKKRKRKIYIAQRAVSAVACVFAAFIIGLGIRNHYKKPDTYHISDNTVENAVTSSTSAALPNSEETTITTLTTIATTANKTTTQTKSQTTVSSSSAASVQTQQASSTNKAAEATTAKHTTASTASRTSATTTAPVNSTTVTTTVDDSSGGVPYTGGSGEGTGGASYDEGGGDMSVGGGCGPSPENPDLWYSLPDYMAYEDASIDGYTEIYHYGYQISSDNIGGNIGTAVMKSSYPVDGVIKTCNAYAYHINGFSDENIAAIRFDGKSEYYLYLTEDTNYFYIKMQIPSIEQ